MRRHIVRLIFCSLKLLLTRPKLIVGAIRSLSNADYAEDCNYELAYIASCPNHRRQGGALALITALNDEIKNRGGGKCVTKTLKDNDHVLNLYQEHCQNAKISGTYSDGHKEYMYIEWDA